MSTLANLTTYISAESAAFVSGMDQSRGALKRLLGELDPIAGATERYNRQVTMLEKAQASGTLTDEAAQRALQILRQRYEEAIRTHQRVVQSSGQVRAGMQQLGYQVGDVGAQMANGTSILVIFGQQTGQVAQAIAMLTAEGSLAAKVFGGIWLQVAIAVVTVLGVMFTKHHDAADAAGAHKTAEDLLKDALDRARQSAADANHETRQGIQDDLDAAVAAKAKAKAILEGARARLLDRQMASTNDPEFSSAGSGIERGMLQSQISGLTSAIADAGKTIVVNRVKLAKRDMEDAADPQSAIRHRYEDRQDYLDRRVEGWQDGQGRHHAATINEATYRRESAAAIAQRDSALNVSRVQGDGSAEIQKRQLQIADLEKLKATASGADLKKIKAQIALRQKQIGYLEQGVSASAAVAASTGGRGRRGTSAETLAKRAEAERLRKLAEDESYNDEERQARHKLLESTRKTTTSEAERDKLLRDDINAEANAAKRKIADELSAKKITILQAEHLQDLNERNRKQRLQNVDIERATATIAAQYDSQAQGLDAQIATTRIQLDLANTTAERKRLALQLLELEQQQVRIALAKTRDTSQDPKEVQRAKDQLAGLPAIEAGQRTKVEQENLSPFEAYRKQLRDAVGDTNEALESVKVHALQGVEDQIVSTIGKVFKLKGAFGELAGSIIEDLARIEIERLILGATGGGGGGGSGGGLFSSIAHLFGGGRASGGSIDGSKFYMVGERGPELFAPGISGSIIPNGGLRAPRLPAAGGGGGSSRVHVTTDVNVRPSPLFATKVQSVAVHTVAAAAEPIMNGAQARTMRSLSRPALAGGFS